MFSRPMPRCRLDHASTLWKPGTNRSVPSSGMATPWGRALRLRFRLLGDIGVQIDGTAVELGHPRQRVVLAVLLVDVNRIVSVERIIDRIWGTQPPQRAREALYSYLSRLRRVVAGVDGVDIVHHSGGYQLVADPD